MSKNTFLNPEGIRLDSVDSTNTYLKNPAFKPGTWVTTREQTSGRGRHGRTWVSLGEKRIIFSGKISFQNPEFPVSVLPLLIGGSVLRKLLPFAENTDRLTIKWPNDIYLNSQKIGGILVESEYNSGELTVIAGIGLNLYGANELNELTTAGFLFSSEISDDTFHDILYGIVANINRLEYILSHPQITREEINFLYDNSYLKDKKIETLESGIKITGIVNGFNDKGFLILKQESGEIKELMDTSPDFRILSNG